MEYQAIKLLENEYKNIQLFKENKEYNDYNNLCLIKQIERNDKLNNAYSSISNLLLSIQQFLSTPIIYESQRLINENSIDILLLKSKIIKLNKLVQNGQLFIKNLLARYFADYFIKLLIKQYPFKFNLSLINIYEIVSTYGVEIVNKNDLELINSLIENLLSKENNENKNEYLIHYINKTKEDNKVIFKDSIKIQNKTIKKDELNFVLGALLYLKQLGNLLNIQK